MSLSFLKATAVALELPLWHKLDARPEVRFVSWAVPSPGVPIWFLRTAAGNLRRLICLFHRYRIRPRYGHCGNAILRAAFDDPVGVCKIDERVAFWVNDSNNVQALE
jgi:hypothetical protein